MEIIVANKPGLPLVSFALMARAGATGDPADLPGLSSFTAAMMDEGTTNRTSQEISAAFEHIGSRLATEARKEYTLLTAETLGRHWQHALGLAADVARNANFPEHELDTGTPGTIDRLAPSQGRCRFRCRIQLRKSGVWFEFAIRPFEPGQRSQRGRDAAD